MRIILVEDDLVLSHATAAALQQQGYAVDQFFDGEEAEQAIEMVSYDVILLDLGLPQKEGLSVLKAIREKGISTPVLILTARDSLEDRVSGLNLGADDYLVKPFDLPELEARIRALSRRRHVMQPVAFSQGSLKFDRSARRAYIHDKPLELSAREMGVLEMLLNNPNRVVSKEEILENICNWEEDLGTNAVEVYIHRLRKKLEPTEFNLRTIRGLGYLFECACS
jgi:two-component system, OmpR family, response regulator